MVHPFNLLSYALGDHSSWQYQTKNDIASTIFNLPGMFPFQIRREESLIQFCATKNQKITISCVKYSTSRHDH